MAHMIHCRSQFTIIYISMNYRARVPLGNVPISFHALPTMCCDAQDDGQAPAGKHTAARVQAATAVCALCCSCP